MRWYEGDIAQAVTVSKSKNAIFVVYVEGKDDVSTKLTALINEGEISAKLESNAFVAIKIEAGTVVHNQFSAIYKNIPTPSIVFIGKNGKPIDIVKEPSLKTEFASRINGILQQHTGLVPSTPEQSAVAKQSEDLIKSEQQPEAAAAEKPSNISCENGVCHLVTDKPTTSSLTETAPETPDTKNESADLLAAEKNELSKEDKVQRAKELVEQKREVKKQEEEEIEKLKEIERRKLGQDVQKMRRWQQDQELKTLMEERQRAKNEEKAARDRILAQIAQDKADRASRFSTQPPGSSSTSDTVQRSVQSNSASANTARLQFRLPDGTNKTHEFDSTATLQEVRDFVVQNLHLPFRNFTLSTTFPRREFTAGDNNETLKALELCPNAVILILPGNSAGTVAHHDGGGFMSMFWLLVSPFLSIFSYFKGLIFGQQPQTDTSQPPERNKRTVSESEASQSSP